MSLLSRIVFVLCLLTAALKNTPNDFGVFRHIGLDLTARPLSTAARLYAEGYYAHLQPGEYMPVLYPPFFFPYLLLFAALPAAYLLWVGLTAAWCRSALHAARADRKFTRLVGVGLCVGTPVNMMYGHTGVYITAALLSGYALLQHKPLRAGLLWSLPLFKPQFCLPALPMLLLQRRFRAAAGLLSGIALQTAAALYLFGADTFVAYAHMSARIAQIQYLPFAGDARIFCIANAALTLSVPIAAAMSLQTLCSAGIFGLSALAWHRDRHPRRGTALLCAALCAGAPYLMFYDTLFAGAACLLHRGPLYRFEKIALAVIGLHQATEILNLLPINALNAPDPRYLPLILLPVLALQALWVGALLRCRQRGVASAGDRDQRSMRAALDNRALVHDQNLVGIDHR